MDFDLLTAARDGGSMDGGAVDAFATKTELDPGWTPAWTDLVGYWKLNGSGTIGSGATVTATVGSDATTVNANAAGMTYAPGQLSTGISFDGADDAMSAPLDLSGTKKITVMYWMDWNAYVDDCEMALELTSDFNTNAGSFMINPNNCDPGSSGHIAFGLKGNVGYRIAYFTRPSVGTWHQFVYVFDKSVSTGGLSAYIDGQPQTLNGYTFDSANTDNFASSTLNFMSRNESNYIARGILDEVAVWNTALTAADIQLLHERQSAGL